MTIENQSEETPQAPDFEEITTVADYEEAVKESDEEQETPEAVKTKPAEEPGAAAEESAKGDEAFYKEPTKKRIEALNRKFRDEETTRIAETERANRAEQKLRYLESADTEKLEPAIDPTSKPDQSNYATIEDYDRAVAKHAVHEAFAERDAEDAQRAINAAGKKIHDDRVTNWDEKVAEAKKDHPDFDTVVTTAPPNPVIEHEIMENPQGANIAYHFASNPDEADRVFNMYPRDAAREILRLELKFNGAQAPEPATQKPVSQAPAPLKKVGAASVKAPKTHKDMSLKEYDRSGTTGDD
jgi:hypothetical protein